MNNSQTTLRGWQVIIMRPGQQGESLGVKVKAAHGQICLLPMLDIVPIAISPRECEVWCQQIKKVDKLFVVSANAVNCAPPLLLEAVRQMDLQVISMGEATTEALLEKGIAVYFTPPPGSTSESLLNEPFLQAAEVTGQSIAILAPEEGRTVLAQTLQGRRANITWFQVYRQILPQVDLVPYYQLWHQQKERPLFVATSLGMLQNLLRLTPTADKLWLFRQPLVVISLRIAQYAKEFGFQQVFVANGAQDNSLMAALYEAVKVCHTA